jgi:hypothetical protein
MRTRISLALLGMFLAASPAAAQYDHYATAGSPDGPPRWYLGGGLAYGRPEGEFADFVDDSFGGSIHTMVRLDERGILGLRLDGGFLVYGSETFRVPLSNTIGGRIRVDVNTTNNIAYVGVGPQIGLPTGRIRPYVNGYAGVAYLFTESSVRGSGSGESFARTNNYDDATFSYGGGAGLYIPVRHGASPISVDLGVKYLNNGRAKYLREGDIEDGPDGTLFVNPVRSDTDVLAFHVGVSVGVGRRR